MILKSRECAVEVLFEEVTGSAVVAGRVVLRGNRCTKEVARLNMTRADWDDFVRCLGVPGQIRQGAVLFNGARGGVAADPASRAST
jgi:hypothetical protein